MATFGKKVSDGKAVDKTLSSTEVIEDHQLYRVGGWNGIAIGVKASTESPKTLAFEADPPAIYSFEVPAGISPAVGEFLFWTTNDATTFQVGKTHLVLLASSANGQQPCALVTKAKNADNHIQARVLQSGNAALKFGS